VLGTYEKLLVDGTVVYSVCPPYGVVPEITVTVLPSLRVSVYSVRVSCPPYEVVSLTYVTGTPFEYPVTDYSV
jgi:hypothetical protein